MGLSTVSSGRHRTSGLSSSPFAFTYLLSMAQILMPLVAIQGEIIRAGSRALSHAERLPRQLAKLLFAGRAVLARAQALQLNIGFVRLGPDLPAIRSRAAGRIAAAVAAVVYDVAVVGSKRCAFIVGIERLGWGGVGHGGEGSGLVEESAQGDELEERVKRHRYLCTGQRRAGVSVGAGATQR